MNPLTLLEKAINEHGSATILKERLALAADQFKKLEDENRNLKEVNATLEKKVAELTHELEATSIPKEFTEHRGILLKRGTDGKVDPDAYCPTCKIVMSSLGGELPFKCSKCGFMANLNGRELKISLGDSGLELATCG